MSVLPSEVIAKKLTRIPGWHLKSSTICRSFTFADFGAAMKFVNTVATLAEQAGHHPDIDIRYNKVELSLASHDAGGITDKDFDLAGAIDHVS